MKPGMGTEPDGFKELENFAFSYEISPWISAEHVKRRKIELIAQIGSAESIRDYGGLWGVFGLYLLEGARLLKCRKAEMIDVTPREEFDECISALKACQEISVSMQVADFRDPDLYKILDKVDVSLLYEVLLHQDNVEEVVKNVCSKTRRHICVAQPCLKEKLFFLPNGTVNLQFYPEELKDQLRIPSWWPKERRADRFETAFWMWGQTASFLNSVFYGYGWQVDFMEAYDLSEYWTFALLRYVPR